MFSLDSFHSPPQVGLLLFIVGNFAFEVLDLVVVLLLEVGLQLLLLRLKHVLRALLILAILVCQDFDLCFQRHDLLFVVAHLAGQLVLEAIDEGLPTLKLALTLLIINAQVLVLNLDLVEQALDLLEVIRVILLGEGLAELLNFLFESLVLHLEFPELGTVQRRARLSCTRPCLHSSCPRRSSALIFGWVGHSASASTLPDRILRAWRIHTNSDLLEVLQAVLEALTLGILVCH